MNVWYYWKHEKTGDKVKGCLTILTSREFEKDQLEMMIKMNLAGWSLEKKEREYGKNTE